MRRAVRVAPLLAWPWYPGAIAVSTLLALFAEAPLPPAAATRPLLVAIGVSTVVTVLWVRALDTHRGGAAAAIFVMALVGATSPVRMLAFVAAMSLIVVEAAWFRRGTMRLNIPWARLTAALNAVLIVFVGLQIGRAIWLRQQTVLPPIPLAWSVAAGTPRPDIFLILADGHARLDVLANRYAYDASEFADKLDEAGFSESPRSYSNHSLTRYSLSVLLNGRPLSELGQDMAERADENLHYRVLPRSSGLSMLQGAGYETTVISAGYDHLPLRHVDHYVDVGPRAELEEALWGTSAIGQAVDRLTGGYAIDARARVLAEIKALKDLAREQGAGPQFVLAHLPSPHWPMVLNADCTLRPGDGYTHGTVSRGNRAGDATAIRILADQTRCVDTLLAEAVQDIVANRPSAVVIVFSDHGPEELVDLTAPDEAGTHDKLANLFWARTPGKANLFPDDITLVNVLPILANAYLGTSLPLHPNDLFLGPTPASAMFTPYSP